MRSLILPLFTLFLFRAAPVLAFSYEDPAVFYYTVECGSGNPKALKENGKEIIITGEGCLSEDYVNKGHHFGMSWKAARKKGFSPDAAFSVAWNADNIDLYGYSPATFMQAMDRVKAHYAVQVDTIKNMHFDDLYSTSAVMCAWNRYLYRTYAGLLWAQEKWSKAKETKEKREALAAAYLLLGISFHAFEDFYSHSIWVNEENRRNRTWFEVPIEEKRQMTLWTGTYEHPESHGIMHHGEIKFNCAFYNNLPSFALDFINSVGCHALSPLSGNSEGICQDVKACKEGGTVATKALTDFSEFANLGFTGVKIPEGFLITKPGINLDAKWFAEGGVNARGLNIGTFEDLNNDGRKDHLDAFQTAYNLAQRTVEQWLEILEYWMTQSGGETKKFWDELKSGSVTENEMHAQWIDFNKFPVFFPSMGPYPPDTQTCGSEQQYFLRVQLKTADETFASTDSDIFLKTGGREFLLDYLPGMMLPWWYDDFDEGDEAVYWAGPFSSWPSQITIENRVSGAGDIAAKLWKNTKAFAENLWNGILDVLTEDDDVVSEESKPFTVQELVTEPVKNVRFDLNGEKLGQPSMGRYLLDAVIRTSVENGQAKVRVSFTRLECMKESEWDQGSGSDEPYFHAILAPHPGEVAGVVSPVFDPDADGFDMGDVLDNAGVSFEEVRLPLNGVLSLTVVLMENDDIVDDPEARQTKNRQYVTGVKEKAEYTIVGLTEFLAADWKLARVEVAGFSNGAGELVSGTVLTDATPRWVEAGKSVSFNLPKPKAWTLPMLPGFASPDAFPLKEAVVTETTKDHVLLEITYDKKPQDFPVSLYLGAYPVGEQGTAVKPPGVTFRFKPVSMNAQGGNATVEIQCQRTSSSQVSTAGFNVILYEPQQDPKVTFRYSYPYVWKN